MSAPRFAAALALALSLAAPASADDGGPYKIRLVVHVARHRLLTSVFEQQLRLELKDHLQAALGKLAKVEVTATHDRLGDVRANGLQKSLDAWREQTGEKVVFVLIDFDGTRYEIQTRQYDGELRVPSPTVRRERTRDRAFVARAAALLVEQDVGLTGTILSEPDGGKTVRVRWRGGASGVDLGKWLQKGEVALVANPRPSAAEPTLAWTLLRVESPPKDGVGECTLFSRYKIARAEGMKVVLVGTREGPVRVRLVQAKKSGGVENLDNDVRMEFRKHGFEGEEVTVLPKSGGGNGAVIDTTKDDEKGKFDRVAFLSVLSLGGEAKARVPLALIDDRPITVNVPAGNDAGGEALDAYRSLDRNTFGAMQVLAELFKEINVLTANKDKRGEALDRVRQTLKRSQDDYRRLTDDRDEVSRELDKLAVKERRDLGPINARLKQIAATEVELLRLVEVLEKIEKTEADPRRKEWRFQIEAAKGHEKEGDADKAIAVYEKVPNDFSPPELAKHLEKLKKQWATADAGHQKARRFAYDVYPGLKTDDLTAEARWKQAQDALKEFQKAGDRWGPLKMVKATDRHFERLREEAAALKPQLNPDDEKPAKAIAELLTKMAALREEAVEYLAGLKD